jgi:hypothetical protein
VSSDSGRYYDSTGLVWAAYDELGAGNVLAGTDSHPSVNQIVKYQEQTGWATMPVVVRGGRRTADVRTQVKLNLEKGDVLVRNNGGRGHVAMFKEWVLDEDDQIVGARLVESRPQIGAGTFDVDLDYVCDFNWMTRPILSASQSLARGVL